MQIIARFDPSATTSGDFVTYLLSNGIGTIIVWNESNWNLTLTFPNNDTDVCPAWTASIYALTGPQGRITWAQDDQLASNSPPSSMVKVIAYAENENVPGTYPLALVRQTTLGNTIAVGTGSTDIQNDGNVAGTSILETTVSGQVTSNQTWTNDSLVNLSLIIAGVYVKWLKTQTSDPIVQLGAINHLVQILGSLTVNQNLTVTGNATVGGTLTTGTFSPSSISTGTLTTSSDESVGGNLTVIGTSHLDGAIDIYAGLISHAGDIQAYNGAGFNSTSGSITTGGNSNSLGTTTFNNGTKIVGGDHNFNGHNGLNIGTLNLGTGSLSSWSRFSGVGNGSFAHGLGTTPDIVLPNPCTAGSSSQTIGIAKPYGASNVTVTTGAGLAWEALAIKF